MGGRGAGGGGRTGQSGPAPPQRLGETRGSNVSGKYFLMYGVPLAMWIRARLGIGQKVFESHRIHNFFFNFSKQITNLYWDISIHRRICINGTERSVVNRMK